MAVILCDIYMYYCTPVSCCEVCVTHCSEATRQVQEKLLIICDLKQVVDKVDNH